MFSYLKVISRAINYFLLGQFFAWLLTHSRPQRPCSFRSAPKITTSGQVQWHSGFEWLCKHNRLRPEPIRLVRLDSEHAQSDGKSVNCGLPVLDLARGRNSWCWPKGTWPLGMRMLLTETALVFFLSYFLKQKQLFFLLLVPVQCLDINVYTCTCTLSFAQLSKIWSKFSNPFHHFKPPREKLWNGEVNRASVY